MGSGEKAKNAAVSLAQSPRTPRAFGHPRRQGVAAGSQQRQLLAPSVALGTRGCSYDAADAAVAAAEKREKRREGNMNCGLAGTNVTHSSCGRAPAATWGRGGTAAASTAGAQPLVGGYGLQL